MSQTHVGIYVERVLFLSDFSYNHSIRTDSSVNPKYKFEENSYGGSRSVPCWLMNWKTDRQKHMMGLTSKNKSASVVFRFIRFILSVVAVCRAELIDLGT